MEKISIPPSYSSVLNLIISVLHNIVYDYNVLGIAIKTAGIKPLNPA